MANYVLILDINTFSNCLVTKILKGSSDDDDDFENRRKMIKLQSNVDRPAHVFSKITAKSAGEESEDGGGAWHKYVSKRNQGSKNNLSKSTKIERSSSSRDEYTLRHFLKCIFMKVFLNDSFFP